MEKPILLNVNYTERTWTHHGIAAYFEAGGLGHTPMNLHSPTDSYRETEGTRKAWRLRTASVSRSRALKQLKVWEETFSF